MRKIAAGKFKAQCLSLMDEVQAKGESIVITKHGKPVAKLVPIKREPKKSVFGSMADKLVIMGDLVEPIVTPEEWGENYG